ncbi:MAG: PEP-CTERM sorting domain-containing protein [Planctomycetota bacterium]
MSDALVAAQATESVIAFFSATGLPSGTFSLGPIVTVGTPVGDLGFSFTPVGGETTVAPIAVIPEPATLVLIGLGGLALAGRRKHA